MIRTLTFVLAASILLTGCASTGLRSVTNLDRPTLLTDGSLPSALATQIKHHLSANPHLRAAYLVRGNGSNHYFLIPTFKDDVDITGLTKVEKLLEAHIPNSEIDLFLVKRSKIKLWTGGVEPLYVHP